MVWFLMHYDASCIVWAILFSAVSTIVRCVLAASPYIVKFSSHMRIGFLIIYEYKIANLVTVWLMRLLQKRCVGWQGISSCSILI